MFSSSYGSGELTVIFDHGGIEIGIVLESPFGDTTCSFFPFLRFETMEKFIEFAHMCNKFIAENYTKVPKVFEDAFKEE